MTMGAFSGSHRADRHLQHATARPDLPVGPQQLAGTAAAIVTTKQRIPELTAHMLLIFSMGRPDVLPVGDYGVRKGMQRLYRLRDLPKPDKMERIATPWRPYRSIAAWYLWRSVDEVS